LTVNANGKMNASQKLIHVKGPVRRWDIILLIVPPSTLLVCALLQNRDSCASMSKVRSVVKKMVEAKRVGSDPVQRERRKRMAVG